MVDKQKPLQSGFGHRSTTSDVLAGLDLSGKIAVVTGGHSGLGFETTRALASAGAEVIVAARNAAAAQSAIGSLSGTHALSVDLSDLGNVLTATNVLVADGRGIDLLINNAGIMACPEQRVGQGWEAQFAINHLGHFALTLGLLPVLREGSRIVTVSSLGHHASPIRWGDVQFAGGYDKWLAYGQSKTANALFALHIDGLLADRGIRSFSLHPGKIFTPLQRHLEQAEMVAQGWLDSSGNPADPEFKTVEQGAATQVWAATSPALEGLGGLYCEDCDVALMTTPFENRGICAYARDPGEAERLWRLSLDLVGMADPLR